MNATNVHDDDDDQQLAPVKAWRNLLFMKDGRSVFGAHVHPTEAQAMAAASAGEALLRSMLTVYSDVLVYERASGQHQYKATEYSHAMQIPVTA